MKITDAVRSGVRFRRPSTGYWMKAEDHLFITGEDVIATDWFLDEQAVELRATQIREALHSAFQETYRDPYITVDKDVENLFLEKLGLKIISKSADTGTSNKES